MSQKNRRRTLKLAQAGASIGRIASALNVTVLSVAYELHQARKVR